jgi:hypothetical protein
VSLIRIVRGSAQSLADRARRLAETLTGRARAVTPSALAGGEPNTVGGQPFTVDPLTVLSSLSFELPRETKCRKCGSGLRAVPVRDDYKIVCDDCEYFTYAGPYRQLIADMIGEARATLTRN